MWSALFWLLGLKNEVHTSDTLDSARGSKTRENFWLHCGTIWLISLNFLFFFFCISFPLNKGDTPKNLCQQFYKKDCIDYLNAVGKKITLPYVSFLRFQKHVCALVLYVCLLVGFFSWLFWLFPFTQAGFVARLLGITLPMDWQSCRKGSGSCNI